MFRFRPVAGVQFSPGADKHRQLVVQRRLAAMTWTETDAAFPSQNGTWQSVRNVQRRFRLLRDQQGLPKHTRPHTLRHTYVARLLTAGVPPFQVSRIAGHADLSTTTRIYGHLIDDAPDINEGIRRALSSVAEPPEPSPMEAVEGERNDA